MTKTMLSTLKLPTLGTDDLFETWWLQFKAYGDVKGFAPALTATIAKSVPLRDSVILGDSEPDKATARARARNQLAVASLSMALKKQSDIARIYKAINKDWPSGLAYKTVELLRKHYQPDKQRARADKTQEFHEIKMSDEEDPEVLSERICTVNNKYVQSLGVLPDEEQIVIILARSPEKYSSILATEQRAKTTTLTPDDLIDAMTLVYRSDRKETALENWQWQTMGEYQMKKYC